MTTALPTPPNSVTRPATFNADTDAFLAALVLFQTELNALQASMSPIGRNMLMNAEFRINQYSNASPADDTYFMDRWYALTQTAAIGFSTVTTPENGYATALRLTQSQVTAQRMGFAQIVENANASWMIGNSATLAGRVRCSVATNIRYAILRWAGTGDAVTSDFVNTWTSGTYTNSNFFIASANLQVVAVGVQAVSANTWTQLATLTGAVSTSANLMVFVWTESAVAQNVTLDCDYLQLENGATATPLERRAYTYDLSLCQRYYYRRVYGTTEDVVVCAMNSASGGTGKLMQWPVRMRAAPTLSVSAATDFVIWNAAQSVNQSLSGFPVTTTVDDCWVNGGMGGSSGTAGSASLITGGGSGATIIVNAEL